MLQLRKRWELSRVLDWEEIYADNKPISKASKKQNKGQ